MKKWLAVSLCLFLLVGCSKPTGSLDEQLESNVQQALSIPAGHANYNHAYYSYYLEPGIGRIHSDMTSNVFMKDGTMFVMNLDVPQIVSNTNKNIDPYAGDVLEHVNKVAETDGKFYDYDKKIHPYHIAIFGKDDTCYTILKTDELQFYSVSNELQSPSLAKSMLQIATSCIVDRKEVMNKFSDADTISFNRKKLRLFQNIAPEKGAVDELFDNKANHAGDRTGQFSEEDYMTDDYTDAKPDTNENENPYEGTIEDTFENEGHMQNDMNME